MNKYIILILFLIVFFNKIDAAVNGIILGYVHQKVIESIVPEYKKFDQKLRESFLEKNQEKKLKLKEDAKQIGNDLILNLQNKLDIEKTELTKAQKDIITKVINLIEKRLENLEK